MNKTQTNSILILDDDPAIVEALSLIIEDAGYTLRTLSEGETLESMHADLPGVVLLDIWMSGKDGRDVCTLLKSQETTRDIPIHSDLCT
jgi:CheY-like chemotaxis protein